MKYFILFASLFLLSGSLFAHPGRTNSSGCHGGSLPYHCDHDDGGSISSNSQNQINCGNNECLLGNTCFTKPDNAFCAYDDDNARFCNEGYIENGNECIQSENTLRYPDGCSGKSNDIVMKEVYEGEYCISFGGFMCPGYNYCLEIRKDIDAYSDYEITKALSEGDKCSVYNGIRSKRCGEISNDMPQYLSLHGLLMKNNVVNGYIPTNADFLILKSLYPKIDRIVIENISQAKIIQGKLALIIPILTGRNKYVLMTIQEYLSELL